MRRIGLSAICLTFLAISAVRGQNAFLGVLNKTNAAVQERYYLNNVDWYAFDNLISAAFDQNHRHYIFIGPKSANNPIANFLNLYVVDVQTGQILDSPAITNGTITGFYLNGLEYDNKNDSLYAIYTDAINVFYFCTIDLKTGKIGLRTLLPGGEWGWEETCFDNQDQYYYMTNGYQAMVIQAGTGSVLYNYTFSQALLNPVYNNLTGVLYGLAQTSPTTSSFDSITMSTGALHPISTVPYIAAGDDFAYALDEVSGKFIYDQTTLIDVGCNYDSIRVLDINTGATVSVASNPGGSFNPVRVKEYEINYQVDDQTGLLYALDWHPPTNVSVKASDSVYCTGQTAVFTATAYADTTNLFYQWQVNGQNAGTNDSVFVTQSLNNGDTVTCSITVAYTCWLPPIATSNKWPVTIIGNNGAAVSISSSASTICSGDSVLFVATPVNGGATPVFTWQINGINTTDYADSFYCSSLHDGDSVDCVMKTDQRCNMTTSNKISTAVLPSPTVFAGKDTVIRAGQYVQLEPVISGTGITGYQWSPGTGLNNASTSDPLASPITSTDYQLTVSSANGCSTTSKIDIEVYYTLQMPEAFTPNGDGRNDIFRIPPSTPQKIKSFVIFNRRGEMVFETANTETGWDGTLHNQPQPTGVYVWKIEYVDLITRVSAVATGTVVLVR